MHKIVSKILTIITCAVISTSTFVTEVQVPVVQAYAVDTAKTKAPYEIFSENNWNNTDNSTKNKKIAEFADFVASALKIDTPSIRWEAQNAVIAARYSPTQKAIILNPGVVGSGREMCDVLIHEMFHAYQYAHMNDGTLQTEKWKSNDENYIQYTEDSEAFFKQPLEADAYAYVKSFYSTYGTP